MQYRCNLATFVTCLALPEWLSEGAKHLPLPCYFSLGTAFGCASGYKSLATLFFELKCTLPERASPLAPMPCYEQTGKTQTFAKHAITHCLCTHTSLSIEAPESRTSLLLEHPSRRGPVPAVVRWQVRRHLHHHLTKHWISTPAAAPVATGRLDGTRQTSGLLYQLGPATALWPTVSIAVL
jgi:hypothetical protein